MSAKSTFPSITAQLIAVTVFCFLLDRAGLVNGFAFTFIPEQFFQIRENYFWLPAFLYVLPSMFTHTLAHAGWGHLIGNMLFFLAMGPILERVLGARRFLLVYVAGALLSALAVLVFLSPLGPEGEAVVYLGASAAVSSVMGGVLAAAPQSIIGFLPVVNFYIKAWMVVLFFYFEQVTVLTSLPLDAGPSGSALVHLVGLFIGYVVTRFSGDKHGKESQE